MNFSHYSLKFQIRTILSSIEMLLAINIARRFLSTTYTVQFSIKTVKYEKNNVIENTKGKGPKIVRKAE